MKQCYPPIHSLARLLACAGLLVVSHASLAATRCSFSSVTSVSFGIYNVFDAGPNINGIGSLSINCQGGPGPFVVTLSAGHSHSYAARRMKSGGNSLSYNLFTSPARTVVWGDGTGGSSTVTINKNDTTTLYVYGLIPARQDVAVGIYTDNLISIVDF